MMKMKTECSCGAEMVWARSGRTVGNIHHAPDNCEPVGIWRSRRAKTARAVARLGSSPKLAAVPRFDVVCETPAERGVAVRGPDDLTALLRAVFPPDREAFVVVFLNARHETTGYNVVSVGSLNASIVHPREVFKVAILANAASVILAHNHPSGDPEPSEEDLSITKRLVQVGDLVGIGVLDHIVVGDRNVVSFRSRNLI